MNTAAARAAVAAGLCLALAAVQAAAAGASPAGAEPDVEWLLGARRVRHNDAMPLAAMDRDDHSRIAARPGRNLAYLDDEVRLQRRSGPWSFAVVGRSLATLVVDAQTLQLARLIETRQQPAADTLWRTEARLRGFSGAGLEIRRCADVTPQLRAEFSAQLLSLGSWHEREIAGSASYDARSRKYDFAIASDEIFNRLNFEYRQGPARNGWGLLGGLELEWSDARMTLRGAVYDGGRLSWNRVPRQTLRLQADRQGTDADGFVVYGPLLEGRNSQPSAQRAQPWRARAEAAYRMGRQAQAHAGFDWLADFGALPWLGASTSLGDMRAAAAWRLHERRLDASLHWRGLSLGLGLDRLDGNARSRSLALGWRWPMP